MDLRKDIPEQYAKFEYYVEHQFMGDTNDYDIIYRKNLHTQESEIVLDIADVIWVKS